MSTDDKYRHGHDAECDQHSTERANMHNAHSWWEI
jgi:hypothetical protein